MIPDLIGSRKEMFGGGDIGKAITETEWLMSRNQPIPPEPTPAADESLPVKFIDYDGTLLYSYNKEDFLALTEMPANPSHNGLTAQGWNWELADAKTYVDANGSLDIGQMYKLSQDFVNINIHLSEDRLKPTICFNFIGKIEINWGDDSELEDVESDGNSNVFVQHVYSTPGDYMISIACDYGDGATFINSTNISAKNACKLLIKNSSVGDGINVVYTNCIRDLNISYFGDSNNVSFDTQAFCNCYSLKTITFPASLISNIPDGAFENCYSLISITIPDGVTSIGDSAFMECNSLTSIIIPNGVTSIGADAFKNCHSLSLINIPSTVKSIGAEAFQFCHSLSSITIPEGVMSIGNKAFQYCRALTSVTISEGVTSIGEYAFSGCYSLSSISIPNTITSIGTYAFQFCKSLSSIIIPNGITSIGDSAFLECRSLTSITIPNTITSIGSNAFYCCYGLSFIRFEGSTPPTVSNSNAWSGLQADCIIYAPALVLNIYMNKTNYPEKYTYAYVGYATYESGEILPTVTTDQTYSLTWYATSEDAVAQTNPITIGNGSEVYARATTV